MVVLVLVLGERNRGRFGEFLGTGEIETLRLRLLACSPPGGTTTYIRLSSLIRETTNGRRWFAIKFATCVGGTDSAFPHLEYSTPRRTLSVAPLC